MPSSPTTDGVDGALEDHRPVRRADTTRAGLGREGDVLGDGAGQAVEAGRVTVGPRGPELREPVAGQLHDGATLGRLVADR